MPCTFHLIRFFLLEMVSNTALRVGAAPFALQGCGFRFKCKTKKAPRRRPSSLLDCSTLLLFHCFTLFFFKIQTPANSSSPAAPPPKISRPAISHILGSLIRAATVAVPAPTTAAAVLSDAPPTPARPTSPGH